MNANIVRINSRCFTLVLKVMDQPRNTVVSMGKVQYFNFLFKSLKTIGRPRWWSNCQLEFCQKYNNKLLRNLSSNYSEISSNRGKIVNLSKN